MEKTEINPLIKQKLSADVKDKNMHDFIVDILKIEREHRDNKGKIIDEYERTLAKYVRREE